MPFSSSWESARPKWDDSKWVQEHMKGAGGSFGMFIKYHLIYDFMNMTSYYRSPVVSTCGYGFPPWIMRVICGLGALYVHVMWLRIGYPNIKSCPQKNVINMPYFRGSFNIFNANGDALLASSHHCRSTYTFTKVHNLLVPYSILRSLKYAPSPIWLGVSTTHQSPTLGAHTHAHGFWWAWVRYYCSWVGMG